MRHPKWTIILSRPRSIRGHGRIARWAAMALLGIPIPFCKSTPLLESPGSGRWGESFRTFYPGRATSNQPSQRSSQSQRWIWAWKAMEHHDSFPRRGSLAVGVCRIWLSRRIIPISLPPLPLRTHIPPLLADQPYLPLSSNPSTPLHYLLASFPAGSRWVSAYSFNHVTAMCQVSSNILGRLVRGQSSEYRFGDPSPLD